MGNNVLCVEDNPDNMILLKRVLETRGYKLFLATTGSDAIAIAEKEDIDLVLLDINLPDIDGYGVARQLRGSNKHALTQIPIIAITANALRGDAEKALDSGCDVYMAKPINIHELWARVEGLLSSR